MLAFPVKRDLQSDLSPALFSPDKYLSTDNCLYRDHRAFRNGKSSLYLEFLVPP